MKTLILHEGQQVKWLVFGRGSAVGVAGASPNTYLLVSEGAGLLVDPGGLDCFPDLLKAVAEVIPLSQIVGFFSSHQDQSVLSALPLWLDLNPNSRLYLSWLWQEQTQHLGNDYRGRVKLLSDEGGRLVLGNGDLSFVPAHYLYAPGNFHLYDHTARILYSGDVGTATINDRYPMVVEGLGEHKDFMEPFHSRWMPSNEAKDQWLKRVRRLDPQMICPRQGSVIMGQGVADFMDWFAELKVGKVRFHAA